jgi:hypothetical protein
LFLISATQTIPLASARYKPKVKFNVKPLSPVYRFAMVKTGKPAVVAKHDNASLPLLGEPMCKISGFDWGCRTGSNRGKSW